MKWLGLGALAAPVVMSPGWRRVEAQAAQRPKRLLLLFTPHGAPAEYFWPQSDQLCFRPGERGVDPAAAAKARGEAERAARHQLRRIQQPPRGINYVASNNPPAIRDTFTGKGPDSIDTIVARKLGGRPLRLGVIPDYAQNFTVDGQLAFEGGAAKCQGARELIACGAAKLIAQISMGGGSTIEPQRGEQLGAAKLIACVGHRAASAA
jgi:hypothetical protein